MNEHIDKLKEWFDSGEEGPIRKGDTYIARTEAFGHSVKVATVDLPANDARRVLSRAPKPAWHKARAVIAECKHDAPDQGWGTFINDGRGHWLDESGKRYVSADLTDVTPLIEAKVTDEMVNRLETHFLATANMALPDGLARRILTAALGLETE